MKFSQPSGKILIAGQKGQELRGGAGEGGVTRDEPGEWRRDECRALIGPPVLRQNPADTDHIGFGVLGCVGSAPRAQLNFSDVLTIRSRERVPPPGLPLAG